MPGLLMIPSTGIPKRIAALFNRRPTTSWSEKEIKAYKQLAKGIAISDLENDMTLLERYYASERRKGDKGIHRRDLGTFLNNFRSETDRAREWSSRLKSKSGYTEKTERKLGESTEEDFKKAGEEAKKLIESLRMQLRPT